MKLGTTVNWDKEAAALITGPCQLQQKQIEPSRPFQTMADKYPKYYKRVGDRKELDVYAVCQMFPVVDPSGAINHARKKLLVPGVRTGGKSLHQDITEARDTLNRWLELNEDPQAPK